MKNLILLAIGATLLSTSAFASKARLEALGEDHFGSQYVDDNRNMFLNAAQIHNHNDFLIFEAGDTGNTLDTASTPKASGGYFARNGGAIYGIYFGQDSNTAAGLRAAPILGNIGGSAGQYTAAEAGVVTNAVENNNTLDIFYGRDGAMKWAARLSYSSSEIGQAQSDGTDQIYEDSSQSAMLLGLGAISGDWEYYINAGLNNEAEVNGITPTSGGSFDFAVKGGLGLQIGAIKDLGDGAKGFVEVRQINIEETELDALDGEWSVQRINLGYGKAQKMNDTLTAFYRVEYFQETNENYAYVEDYEIKTSFVKATMGFEAMATSWLTLRGSVANNLISEEDVDGSSSGEDGKRTIDAVNVALGATVKFGDFSIDGLITNDTDGDGALDEVADTTTEENDKDGVLRTDSLMSRVSFTYNF
tara:strand:+ start:5763 stop:7016 length:1254 start_codon:yes stop_codon:yes gene_type:complete